MMGPHDNGKIQNKELGGISHILHTWFEQRGGKDAPSGNSQGWLEYLYGCVLSKERNLKEAMDYLVKSVHIFPLNWGCWQEINSLITRVTEVNSRF